MATELRHGDILEYPYLWAWQKENGETEGRKERPVCLLVSIAESSGTALVFLALTSTAPGPDNVVVEIPAIEARRAGLDDWKRGWVVVSEANFDSLENSWYLAPDQSPRGRFSPNFLSKISARFQDQLRSGGFQHVKRSE